jgi:hypothetical protein
MVVTPKIKNTKQKEILIFLVLHISRFYQTYYINALAVSVSPFFEPAMPITLGGLFVTFGGFVYDIG